MSELREGGGFLVEPTMRVDGHRDLDVAVTDDLADDVRWDTKSEQQRDGRVSKIVKAQRGHPGVDAYRAPLLAQAVGRRRLAATGGEHEPGVRPALARLSVRSSSWRLRCSCSADITT
jgi:hypothetical protein